MFQIVQLDDINFYNLFNNTITGYETGILLHSSGTTLIEGSNSTTDIICANDVSNCGTGVELYNSVAYIRANNIHDNFFGVKLYNNCYTSFNNYLQAHQFFRDNDSFEVYISESSFPIKFQHNQIIDEDNLGNSFDDPMIYWDIDPPSECFADIFDNYWGENFDPLEDIYPFEALCYDPVWDPGKSSSKSGATPEEDETRYQAALSYFSEEDYTAAETAFKELIETYPHSRFAIAALHELFALQHVTYYDFASLRDYYATFTPSDSTLFNTADFLATRCYVKEKYWQPAVDWYEYRIENPPSYQDSVFAVIDLGDIHLMMAGDTLGAKGHPACHYSLAHIKPKSKQEYETHKANLLATLPQIKKPQTEKPQVINKTKKGVLGQNIPNPATGTTTISYEIYTESTIELRVYNVMGQLVQAVSQGKILPGYYNASLNVSDLSAGIYHYSLFVNGEQTDVRKMVVSR